MLGALSMDEIGAKSFTGSYGTLLCKKGVSQKVLLVTRSVYPSGAALATVSPGMTPLGRFSTITD
jgi:hypothetical protein